MSKMTREDIICHTLGVEGGYSDHARDTGGKTMFGITEKVARSCGYSGSMRDLSLDTAISIYTKEYWDSIRLDDVIKHCEHLAQELFDTGVNMGVGTATKFLQGCLNALNNDQKYFVDLVEDGAIGNKTIAALDAIIADRGPEGGRVLCTMINCLQGARYVGIAKRNPSQRAFMYGWCKNRL